MYYSIFDRQTNRIMDSGKNSLNKKEAIDAIFNWWCDGDVEFTDREINKLGKDKANWIEAIGFNIIEHEERMEKDI